MALTGAPGRGAARHPGQVHAWGWAYGIQESAQGGTRPGGSTSPRPNLKPDRSSLTTTRGQAARAGQAAATAWQARGVAPVRSRTAYASRMQVCAQVTTIVHRPHTKWI